MIEARGGRLTIDGVSAEPLARRFGTPLYAYSTQTIDARYAELSRAFRSQDPLLCYALKANSNRALCRRLARLGAGAEVVSGGELWRALRAGFKPERISFSGVGKSDEELEMAARTGILSINLESEGERIRLERIARRMRRRPNICVRLNPGIDARTHSHIATGRAADKFGLERRAALALLLRAARGRWLRPVGVQCHIGSQVTSPEPYGRAAKAVRETLEAAARAGLALELADLGGGFGIAYKDAEPGLDLAAAAWAIGKALGPRPGLRLLLEPGRWLVAESGVLLTRVVALKENGGRRFVIVDAAMNDLARPALYGAYHPIVPATLRKGSRRLADVVGPICESGDFLARARALPPLREHDLLAVLKAGAYGFSMSSQYNSRPRAAEVLVESGRARLVRRRETIAELVADER